MCSNNVTFFFRDGTLKLWQYEKSTLFGIPTLCYSVKADSKSVNAACFVGRNEEMLVTGSDSGLLRAWKIMKTQRGTFLKKSWVYQTNIPVTKVMPASEDCVSTVLVTGWSGRIKVVDMENGFSREDRFDQARRYTCTQLTYKHPPALT